MMNHRRHLVSFTLAVAWTLGLVACGSTSPTPGQASGSHDPAVPIATLDMAGVETSVVLSGQDKPTLMIFEASWCESCNREAPRVVAFANAHADDVRIIGVLVDELLPAAQSFVDAHGIPYRTVWDPKLEAADRFGVEATPAYLLLDRDGREVTRVEVFDASLEARFAARPVAPVAPQTAAVERHTTMMATNVDILVVPEARHTTEAEVDADIEAAFAEMRRIETLMSEWQETSEVSAVNRAAGDAPVKVSPDTFAVLRKAKSMAELTQGRFDVTVQAAAGLWDFRRDPPAVPSEAALDAALKHVGSVGLILDDIAQTAFLARPGMAIGLGGIAKGYAVDRAVATLLERGYSNFVVNAGGDVYAHGRKSEASLWWVALKHPRREGESMAALPVSNRAVVTSGDYERFFMMDGVRYSHILDPTTLMPATGCQSVTVVAGDAAWADALATGVFVLGPARGMALVEDLANVEAMIIDEQGKAHVSSGLKKPAPKL